VQRGFELGSGTVWDPAFWEDAFLRAPRQAGVVSSIELVEVIGDVVLTRLEQQRRLIDALSPLTGRWLPAEQGGVVLQVFSGRTLVAELLDADANGRVDLVLLNAGLKQENPRNAR
jgi:hypothetical protein